jgi:hypothetical protein
MLQSLIDKNIDVVAYLMVFNAIFNNISLISWRSVLLVEKIGGPRRKPPICHKSHNVVCPAKLYCTFILVRFIYNWSISLNRLLRQYVLFYILGDRHGHDRMVVGFTLQLSTPSVPITTLWLSTSDHTFCIFKLFFFKTIWNSIWR